MSSIDIDELTKRLESHATFFDDKLSFIPPKVYWAGKSDPEQYKKRNTSKKGEKKPKNAKAGKPPKPKHHESRKFNPNRATVPELIDQGNFGGGRVEETPIPMVEAGAREPSTASEVVPSEKSPKELANSHLSEIAEKLGFVPGSAAKSPSELKQRMALLRDWYKQKEMAKRARGDEEQTEEKKRARQLKKQKQKEKRKSQKLQKKHQPQPTPAEAEAAQKQQEEMQAKASSQNGEALSLDFSSFKFSTGRSVPLYKEKRGRDVELLRKAEAEREKKKEWEQQEDGREKIENLEWSKLMAKAQGEKIRDDPAMLKKTIKKKERKKKKTQAEWADKYKAMEKAKKEKQSDYLRRQEKNLVRRKHGRRAMNQSAAPASRKGRAGFEGKKKLNK